MLEKGEGRREMRVDEGWNKGCGMRCGMWDVGSWDRGMWCLGDGNKKMMEKKN